jgi:hypothetical protein
MHRNWHEEQIKEKKVQVMWCNRVFSDPSNHNYHSQNPNPRLHDPSVIQKPRVKTKKWNLEDERKKQFTECVQEKRFKFDECCFLKNLQTSFSLRSALLRHQRTCHGENKYQCKIPGCNRVFYDPSTSNSHYRNPNPRLHDPSLIQKPRVKTRERNLEKKMYMQTSYSGKLSGRWTGEELFFFISTFYSITLLVWLNKSLTFLPHLWSGRSFQTGVGE